MISLSSSPPSLPSDEVVSASVSEAEGAPEEVEASPSSLVSLEVAESAAAAAGALFFSSSASFLPWPALAFFAGWLGGAGRLRTGAVVICPGRVCGEGRA